MLKELRRERRLLQGRCLTALRQLAATASVMQMLVLREV